MKNRFTAWLSVLLAALLALSPVALAEGEYPPVFSNRI